METCMKLLGDDNYDTGSMSSNAIHHCLHTEYKPSLLGVTWMSMTTCTLKQLYHPSLVTFIITL